MSMVRDSRAFADGIGSPTTRRGAGGRVRLALGLLAAAFAGTLTFGASSGMAATTLTDYTTNFTRVESPDPQASGRWSERLATVPDLNGDGKNEILIGDLNESFGGVQKAGKVYMQDGATRNMLYSITSPEIQSGAQFGFFISVIGDVNGDGKADFAAGTDGQATDATTGASCALGTANCNFRAGKAWVFSGANGQMLYALNDPDHQAGARFGSRIGRAGDVNGDGIQDIIVGASGTDNPVTCAHVRGGTDGKSSTIAAPAGCRNGEGAAYIFSGKDGTLIRKLNLPAADEAPATTGCNDSCGSFGLAVQGPGDVNSDGFTDQLIDAASFNYDPLTRQACLDPAAATCNAGQGAMYLFSGKDGTLIRRIDDPAPQAGATFGFQDAAPLTPGDVNGDGAADIFGNGFDQNGATGLLTAGRAWIFNGKTGDVIYELHDPTPVVGGQFAFSADRTDYNQDGTPDIYVGKAPHDVSAQPCTPSTVPNCGSDQSGGTYIFDGRDGSLLKSLVLPPSDSQKGENKNLGSNLGWSVAAPGDLNGDGQPDYVAGSPWTDVGPSAFNCQASSPGCTINVGREFFFYSNVPAATGGTTGTTGGTTGTTPTTPGTKVIRPPGLPRANLPGLRLSARRLVRGRRTLFIVRGSLRLPPSIAGSQRLRVCHGSVSVAAGRGHKTGATRTVQLRRDCSFSLTLVATTRKLGHKGRYNVRARFHGNTNINARSQTTNIH